MLSNSASLRHFSQTIFFSKLSFHTVEPKEDDMFQIIGYSEGYAAFKQQLILDIIR